MRFRINDGKPYLISGGRAYPVEIRNGNVRVALEQGELTGDKGQYCIQEVIAKLGGNVSGIDRKTYSKETLDEMTVAEIKSLAESAGYEITETRKADIIEQFLEQQEG